MRTPEAEEIYRNNLVQEILNEIGTSGSAMSFYNKVFELTRSSDEYRNPIYKTQDIPGAIQNLGTRTLDRIKSEAFRAKGKTIREIVPILNKIKGSSKILSEVAERVGVSIKPNDPNSLLPKEPSAILNDLNALSPKELFAILEELNKPINP